MQLSLTTDYFRDLNELISPAQLTDDNTRGRIIDYCTRRIVGWIVNSD